MLMEIWNPASSSISRFESVTPTWNLSTALPIVDLVDEVMVHLRWELQEGFDRFDLQSAELTNHDESAEPGFGHIGRRCTVSLDDRGDDVEIPSLLRHAVVPAHRDLYVRAVQSTHRVDARPGCDDTLCLDLDLDALDVLRRVGEFAIRHGHTGCTGGVHIDLKGGRCATEVHGRDRGELSLRRCGDDEQTRHVQADEEGDPTDTGCGHQHNLAPLVP